VSTLVLDFGKKILLPVGYCQIDAQARAFMPQVLKQVEELPEYNESTKITRNYEELVRTVYRTPTKGLQLAQAQQRQHLEASVPLDADYSASRKRYLCSTNNATDDLNTYSYQQDPSVYDLNAHDHQTLKLYEEQVANKNVARQEK